MATDHGHGNGAARNASVEYDRSDLSAKGILIFLFVLAAFAVAIHLTVLGLYVGMTRIAEKHEPETSPLVSQTVKPRDGILMNTANVNLEQFPEPRLLKHPTQTGIDNRFQGEPGEMTKFLVEESAALTAQPWQDEHGNVHLPIDQAMNAVLTRLPARAGSGEVSNYPGAARQYSYPPADADALPSESMPDGAMQGEGGNPSAVK
jgi:hypothetical protein